MAYFNTTPRLKSSATQVVTASSAYSSGNCVGGLITFTNAANNWGSGYIESIVVRDKAGQSSNYELWLFDANPAATTVTDKSAIAVNTADLAKCIGVVAMSAVKLGASSTMAVSTATGVFLSFSAGLGNTSLYGILVTRSTPTYASTADVTVAITVNPN